MGILNAIEDKSLTALERETLMVMERIAPMYARWVKWHVERNKLSLEEAHAEAQATFAKAREWAQDTPPKELSWFDLSSFDEAEVQKLWKMVKVAARAELESGFRAGDAVASQATPFQRAQFLVLRESFIDGWKPSNQIEVALLDMMAQQYSLYIYWSAIAHERATHESEESRIRSNNDERWVLPRQWEADAIEQAYRLADGYNRQFLRTLRQMRDLRRYSPVIFNLGGQVNVAGQQVNVSTNSPNSKHVA